MIGQEDIHIYIKEKKSCPEVDNFNLLVFLKWKPICNLIQNFLLRWSDLN